MEWRETAKLRTNLSETRKVHQLAVVRLNSKWHRRQTNLLKDKYTKREGGTKREGHGQTKLTKHAAEQQMLSWIHEVKAT